MRWEEMRYFSVCDRCGDQDDLGADELPAGWTDDPDGETLCADCAANVKSDEG